MTERAPESDSPLARLLLEQRDTLFSYVLALVRTWSVAEELFQEVSLVILQKDREGLAVRDFGPWSREIARRTVLNYWKTSSRTRLVLSASAVDSIDREFVRRDEESEAGQAELLPRLRRCLTRLPDHLRRMVDLRYQEGLPLQEIARRLNRSAGSVQVALSRIRMRLLDCTRRTESEAGGAPA